MTLRRGQREVGQSVGMGHVHTGRVEQRKSKRLIVDTNLQTKHDTPVRNPLV